MKSSTTGRLDKIEKLIVPAHRVHFIWDDGTPGAFEREKAARIASGQANEGDRFLRTGWKAAFLR
jgi:hypothetical protein